MQAAAHQAVSRALQKGELVKPETCSSCGHYFNYLEAHHTDYHKPLDVKWLCRRCHYSVHKECRVNTPKRNVVEISKPTVITLAIDDELLNVLDAYAEQSSRTRSHIMRKILWNFFDVKEKAST